MKTCLRCTDPERPLYSRGLCHPCYQYCRGMVLRGKLTWEQLIANGYALDRGVRGRHPAPDVETMLTTVRSLVDEKLPPLQFICQEPGCDFSGTDVSAYTTHRKETSHHVKMVKYSGAEVTNPSLAEEAIELANLAIGGEPETSTGK